MNLQFKILGFDEMIKWFIKHKSYRNDFEQLMKIHNSESKYNIGTLISNNLNSNYKQPLLGKIILVINKDGELKEVASSAIAELETSDKIYISNVFVKEEYRGKKLCQTMLMKLMESYKDDKNGTFMLDVNKANIGAIKCYENLGFKVIQEKHFYKDGQKSYYYVMEKV